jgi:hypothetical protein
MASFRAPCFRSVRVSIARFDSTARLVTSVKSNAVVVLGMERVRATPRQRADIDLFLVGRIHRKIVLAQSTNGNGTRFTSQTALC